MVSIRKKMVEGKAYYYLEHSMREGKTIKKLEHYLGTDIPAEIESIKTEFISEVNKVRWHKSLENIKSNFSKERISMPKSARDKEIQSFMIKFTYDTQKIEGSKLTLRETANLLEHAISPKEKPVRDAKEAEAHKEIFYEMLKSRDISLAIVLLWHRKLFNSTKPDVAGKIRSHGVAISGSRFIPPSPVEVEPLLDDFFSWYNKNKGKLHPIELASRVHLKFVTIHPFSDGNGRISRLMMNFVLNKHGYPLLDIPYEDRNSYYNALERSQTKKNEQLFIRWFMSNYIKANKRYS
jgi:Fic family protein